jgi:hypothetical protein
MRNFMTGFAILGVVAIGTVAPAVARPLPVAPAGQSNSILQADWDGDGCGPRCREYRREERERELEHRRWEQHRRWEESRYPPPAYGYRY